jgi:hypothetical protein
MDAEKSKGVYQKKGEREKIKTEKTAFFLGTLDLLGKKFFRIIFSFGALFLIYSLKSEISIIFWVF